MSNLVCVLNWMTARIRRTDLVWGMCMGRTGDKGSWSKVTRMRLNIVLVCVWFIAHSSIYLCSCKHFQTSDIPNTSSLYLFILFPSFPQLSLHNRKVNSYPITSFLTSITIEKKTSLQDMKWYLFLPKTCYNFSENVKMGLICQLLLPSIFFRMTFLKKRSS